VSSSSSTTADLASQLRAAWESTRSDSELDLLMREQLEASAVGIPALESVLVEMKSIEARTQLDLHLDGDNVQGHSTDAERFGSLVSRAATAVKEIVKTNTGRRRLPARLLIEAPTPGSVRVVLREPDLEADSDQTDDAEFAETAEGVALRQLGSLLALASIRDVRPDESDLGAAFIRVSPAARVQVRELAKTVLAARWIVVGEVRAPMRVSAPFEFDALAAQRLIEAADSKTETSESIVQRGVVDGWIWSQSVMVFQPENGRHFRAVVPEDLQSRAAELVQAHEAVTGRFTVVTVMARGSSGSAVARSFALESIEEASMSRADSTLDTLL